MRVLQLSAALAVALTTSASAGTITFSGNFTQDDDRAYFQYSTHSSSQVFVYTTSNGDPLHMGFVPELFLFDPSGTLVKSDDGYPHFPSDAALDYVSIFPDQPYTIVLTQHDNEPTGGPLGIFTRDGQPDFTADISGLPGPFRDPGGVQLTGYWSVTFFSVDPTLVVTPEPATLWLGAGGVLLMLCAARRRADTTTK